MRTLKEIIAQRNADTSKQWTKRFLTINVICGVLLGTALFAQDAMAVKPAIGHATDLDELWLDVNVASKHFGLDGLKTKQGYREFNEDNFGLGLTWQSGDNIEYGLGFYDNSFGATTVYAGFDIHTNNKKALRFGVSFASVTGYKDFINDAPFTIMPNVVWAFGPGNEQVFRIKVGVIPALNGIGTLQFGVNF